MEMNSTSIVFVLFVFTRCLSLKYMFILQEMIYHMGWNLNSKWQRYRQKVSLFKINRYFFYYNFISLRRGFSVGNDGCYFTTQHTIFHYISSLACVYIILSTGNHLVLGSNDNTRVRNASGYYYHPFLTSAISYWKTIKILSSKK